MNVFWNRLFSLDPFSFSMDEDDSVLETGSAAHESATPRELANRLEHLEHTQRRWRILTVGFGLAVAAVLAESIWTRSRPRAILEVRELIVRDDQGMIRARLGADDDDGATLVLQDGEERPQARLQTRADRSSQLEMLERKGGNPRLILGAGSDGLAGLHFYDHHHIAVTMRSVSQDSGDLLFSSHRFGAAHSFAAALARPPRPIEPPSRVALTWNPQEGPDAIRSESSSITSPWSPVVIDDPSNTLEWSETELE